jgi:hypothetical protein
MSRLRRVANWIDFFVSLVAAVYILNFIFQMAIGIRGFWRQVLTFETQRAGVVWAGLVLAVLLVLVAVLRAVQHAKSSARRYLVFDTPNGEVSVRGGSVEEVINRTVRAMPEVADAEAGLILPSGARVPSAIRIRCRLYNRPNLLSVQDQVRAVVRQCYLEMFPSEEELPVQISVERIIFESKAAKPAPRPAPAAGDEDDAEPIRPQYPVGDDEK